MTPLGSDAHAHVKDGLKRRPGSVASNAGQA